jgi:putative CocE/NonD family hydrolase
MMMAVIRLVMAASLALAGASLAAQTVTQATVQTYPDVIRHSLYVPVRDGTKLAVNIYQPAQGDRVVTGQLPVIFAFTPYRARIRAADGTITEVALGDRLALRSLVRAGYVVAVADIRGKGASFGARRGFQDRTEANDGYDLIEWLAKQSFSTGKVGMVGCSYLGGTTFQTTSTAPPSLKAAFIGASELDKYAFVRRGGITAQFNTRPDEPLSDDLMSLPVDADGDGALLRAAVAQHAQNTPMGPLWYGMAYRDSISSYTGNAFWEEVGVYNYLGAIRRAGIPTYFWGNWQDEPTSQTILGAANLGGKFLAGPGGHCVPPPGFDFTGEVQRYFDHYLKGTDNGIEREPRATYWVEGLNGSNGSAASGGWVRSNSLPGTASHRLSWSFAGGKSGTARSVNDGMLGQQAGGRASKQGRDSFTTDYNLPSADYFAFWAKPMDDHGLSYTSQPLAAPLALLGMPVVHLAVTSSKPDADIWAYLDQVKPNGSTEVIAFGRLALAHRKLGRAPYDVLGLPWHSGRSADVAPLPVGAQAQLDFDLTAISRVVPSGDRLRVTITGADPRQRNLASIKQTPPPVITVLRGGRGGSRIDLPVSQ